MSVNNKLSAKLASKVHRLAKMLKPVMKLMHGSKKSRKIVVDLPPSYAHGKYQPSTFADEADGDQNAANEALESRLRDDIIRSSTDEGGQVGLWINGHVTVLQGHQLERIPIPVKFAYTPAGDFLWAPLPDSDICLGGSHHVHTTNQTAVEQVPVHLTW